MRINSQGSPSSKSWHIRNELLLLLPPQITGTLMTRASTIECAQSEILPGPDGAHSVAYFPESGILAARIRYGARSVDAAYLGREGMAGTNPLVPGPHSSAELVVRAPGTMIAIPAEALAEAMKSSEPLRTMLGRAARSHLAQMESMIAAAALGTIKQRLAHWLLSYCARAGLNEIACSHALISGMLGVRRSSVTVNLHHLEGAGAIRCTRVSIVVRDEGKLLSLVGDLRPLI